MRSFNKHLLNPVMLLFAGRRWFYAGVIRHVGRRTRKSYYTPVVVNPVRDDGFVIPLPYGTAVDWLRNVLDAGGATVEFDGDTYTVTDPEVIDADSAATLLSARRRREFARLGIDDFVLLRRVDGRKKTTTRR